LMTIGGGPFGRLCIDCFGKIERVEWKKGLGKGVRCRDMVFPAKLGAKKNKGSYLPGRDVRGHVGPRGLVGLQRTKY